MEEVGPTCVEEHLPNTASPKDHVTFGRIHSRIFLLVVDKHQLQGKSHLSNLADTLQAQAHKNSNLTRTATPHRYVVCTPGNLVEHTANKPLKPVVDQIAKAVNSFHLSVYVKQGIRDVTLNKGCLFKISLEMDEQKHHLIE